MRKNLKISNVSKRLLKLQEVAYDSGLEPQFLLKYFAVPGDSKHEVSPKRQFKKTAALYIAFTIVCIVFSVILGVVINSIFGARCLLPSNYMIWEATRPISDCSFCVNVTGPIILWNVTRSSFEKYAYISRPIIVKKAIHHWKAIREFDFDMFKRLYEETAGSYESLEEGCQFLNFKSDLFSLQEVFEMPVSRARNDPGEDPWYVGWGNCHPDILAKVREYYEFPDFLPVDAEFPATENIFFGYEKGAVMHLDYIPRLMWQGQVKGNKTWSIAPIPECDSICTGFEYYVEPGDIILLDTRVWYHATRIPKGQFSLTVQSEYG